MIELIANAVDARLLNIDRETALEIHNLLSYFVDGFEHSAAYKQHRWDGKSSFFSLKTNSFPAGFVPLVSKRLNELGKTHTVRRKTPPPPLGPDLNACQSRTGFASDPRYDYQHETVKRLLVNQQMIASLVTGAGKSLVGALAYFRIQRPTLFLTTRQALAYQMKSVLEGFGEKVGMIGDATWEPNLDGFTVGMAQSLAPRLKPFDEKIELERLQKFLVLKKNGKPARDTRNRERWDYTPAYREARKRGGAAWKQYCEGIQHELSNRRIKHEKTKEATKALLERFEFVILEEAHESSAEGYYNVMRHCRNAHYRLALTATPFVRDSDEANLRLMACSGPIGIRVDEKTLIDRGILAKPYFKYIEAEHVNGISRSTWPTAYSEGVVHNIGRNKQIVEEAIRGARHGLPVLVLITRTDHGRNLQQMLESRGIRAQFLFGETDNSERQAALSALKNGELQVLVASTVLDVGVDVPSLGMVILAGGGKAEVALRQRIGRGLRAKKTGKNVCFIVDFMDRSNRHLALHSEKRRAMVASTPGFAEGILKDGEDFDYSDFALVAA